MPQTGNGGKDPAKGSGSSHPPVKVPLLGISKIPRGEELSSPSSNSGDEHPKSGERHSPNSSQNLPFKEGTFQTITPRTLSLLTPRSAAAYNAAAFSAFNGGSRSSFSPFYGTAAIQHSFKSHGNLQHYAAKAQDVDDLIKRTELSVDRLRFSSVSFSNAWKMRRMASAVYFTSPTPVSEEESEAKEASFRDTVLAWKFEASGERPENVICKPMDMHQCEQETFCAECTYLFAVFVATLYSPQEESPSMDTRGQRSSSADAAEYAYPQLVRTESDDEQETMPPPVIPPCTSLTPGRKEMMHGHHHHHHHEVRGADSSESGMSASSSDAGSASEDNKQVSALDGEGRFYPKEQDSPTCHLHSEAGQSSSFSSSFSEPTIVHFDWEDAEHDDAEADREIADTLASPPMESTAFRFHAIRPPVPPPEDTTCSLGKGPEDVTLCADRFFDTTMTPRGISSAFATLPRVRDDDVMHVNSVMLRHLGGSSTSLLGNHKEIGIGQVCIDLHIWNGDKSSSFTRAAAFSKALRLDRAWALPSAARAASLLVFSNASFDNAAITTPRGEHVVSRPVGQKDPEHLGPKEYTMSDLIRSKLLRTYRTLAASFSPHFLERVAGRRDGQYLGSYHARGSESERGIRRPDRITSYQATPSMRGGMQSMQSMQSPLVDDGQNHPMRPRHRRQRVRGTAKDSSDYSGSESDNDDNGRMSEFKVPYNVFRAPAARERTCSSPGSASAEPLQPRVDVAFHLDQRQTVSDDEFADEKPRTREAKPDIKTAPPASDNSPGACSLCFRFSPSPTGSAFRPVQPKSVSGSSPESGSPLSPSSPVGSVSPVASMFSPTTTVGSPNKLQSPVSPSSPTGEKTKTHRSRRSERPKSGDGDFSSGKGSSSKMPKLVVKPESIVDSSLKAQGKSLSGSSLSSKKPTIPMLSLNNVSPEPQRNSRRKQLTAPVEHSGGLSDRVGLSDISSKRRVVSASAVRSGTVSPVPRLTISKDLSLQDVTTGDSPSPSIGEIPQPSSVADPVACGCDDYDENGEIDLSTCNAEECDQDRNGGEVNGGMRLYRSVLSKIDDQLYLTGEGGAQDLARLREVGVGQIVNVADAVCHEYHPGKFTYLSIDLQDNGAKEDLRPLFLKTIDFIEKHRTVLHCQQGISRSATIVIAYIMWKNNLTFRQALDYVMKRRPVVSPNGGFMGQLLLWEVVLQNSREARKSSPPRLLRIVPHPGSRHEVLMVGKDVANVSRASLDQRGCFLLHNPATRTVYMWLGNECLPVLAAGGASVCEMMKKYLWVETVLEERQDFESDGFWRALRDNRGSVGIVDEFNREYAPRVPGFIYRYSAFDSIELRSVTLNSLYEQSRRQVWVYYREDKTISIAVPEKFLQRVNGREISDTQEIASITSRFFCIVARLPEDTPFTLAKDGKVLLDEWLGTFPPGSFMKGSTSSRKSTPI